MHSSLMETHRRSSIETNVCYLFAAAIYELRLHSAFLNAYSILNFTRDSEPSTFMYIQIYEIKF